MQLMLLLLMLLLLLLLQQQLRLARADLASTFHRCCRLCRCVFVGWTQCKFVRRSGQHT
jgi:hypothetical protein